MKPAEFVETLKEHAKKKGKKKLFNSVRMWGFIRGKMFINSYLQT